MAPSPGVDHRAIMQALAASHGPVEVREVLELVDGPGEGASRRSAGLAVIRRGYDLEPVLLTGDGQGLRPAAVGDGSLGALVATWRRLGGVAAPDLRTQTGLGCFRLVWEAPTPTVGVDDPVASRVDDPVASRVDDPVASVTAAGERQVSTDHANLSIAVDGVLVKLLSRLAVDPATALRVRRHLAAVGFEAVPPLLGSVSVTLDGRELLVAVASRELQGAQEGWGRVRRRAEAHLRGGEGLAASRSVAAALGALLARFHAAMATPSSVLGAPVREASQTDRARLVGQAEATLAAACGQVPGAAGDLLRAYAGRLRPWLARLGAPPWSTPMIHGHGDLHVGQVLWVDDRPVLTDLDGDAPDTSLLAAMAPPARDLAALLRSLDHVGWLAAQRLPEVAAGSVTRWIGSVRAACRRSYLDTLAQDGWGGLLDERLVAPFEVAQLSHELRYATLHLPDWLPVAEAALRAVIDDGGPPDGR